MFVETYGCQMNVNDSEVVLSVLAAAGFRQVATADCADVVLVNTWAIRENAEAKVGGGPGHAYCHGCPYWKARWLAGLSHLGALGAS